jgi:hypothetical protein
MRWHRALKGIHLLGLRRTVGVSAGPLGCGSFTTTQLEFSYTRYYSLNEETRMSRARYDSPQFAALIHARGAHHGVRNAE